MIWLYSDLSAGMEPEAAFLLFWMMMRHIRHLGPSPGLARITAHALLQYTLLFYMLSSLVIYWTNSGAA